MKFTIWERNNIHTLLGGQVGLEVKNLELVFGLRPKFALKEQEKADWAKYSNLMGRENLSQENQDFIENYNEYCHQNETEVTLTGQEFDFIYNAIMADGVRLPSSESLIEKSIAMVSKLKSKKEKTEEI